VRTIFGTVAAPFSIPAREPISNPAKTEAKFIVIIISAVICFPLAKIKRGATRAKNTSVKSAMTCPTVGEANVHPVSFLAKVEIEQSVVAPKTASTNHKGPRIDQHMDATPKR
jgi:hypothetical protein